MPSQYDDMRCMQPNGNTQDIFARQDRVRLAL